MSSHFDQVPRRRAEFIKPPNPLKGKVGSGGIAADILSKAQQVLESNTMDFGPLAEVYLTTLSDAIDRSGAVVGTDGDHETAIIGMLYPTMQLKANGGMFHYPLVTRLSDKLVQFLEVIEKVDGDVMELMTAFITTVRVVLASKIMKESDPQGRELVMAMDDACRRYFAKHPYNRNPG